MADISVSIPDDLKEEMRKFPEINWSEVALISIRQKIADLKFLKAFTNESEITFEDAETLGKELSKNLNKNY